MSKFDKVFDAVEKVDRLSNKVDRMDRTADRVGHQAEKVKSAGGSKMKLYIVIALGIFIVLYVIFG